MIVILQSLAPAMMECAALWLVLRATLAPSGPVWAGRLGAVGAASQPVEATPGRLGSALGMVGPTFRQLGSALGLALCCLAHLLVRWAVRQWGDTLLPDGAWGTLLPTLVLALVWLGYACAAYRGRLWQKALTVAVFFALLLAISITVDLMSVVGFGSRTLLYSVRNRKMVVPITDVVDRCFLLALCMLYAQLVGQHPQGQLTLHPVRKTTWVLLALLPLAAWVGAMLWVYQRVNVRPKRHLWVAALCLALLLVESALPLVGHWVRRVFGLQQQCRQQLRQQEKERTQAQQLRELFDSQRAQTHEYRNRLTVLSMLLAQQQYDQAAGFLQQLTQHTYQDSPTVQTNHPIADAVLNLKYAQAREQQTAMRFTVGDLSGLPFTDDEVVKLLGNLLDNALDACRKLEDHREIDIKLLCQEGGVVISIRNPLPPQDAAPRPEPLLHGFGLQTVERVLQRYQIPHAITREYGWFQFTAIGWPDDDSEPLPAPDDA